MPTARSLDVVTHGTLISGANCPVTVRSSLGEEITIRIDHPDLLTEVAVTLTMHVER